MMNLRRLFSALVSLSWVMGGVVLSAPALASERYKVENGRLIFNTEVEIEGQDEDLSFDDVEPLRKLLRGDDSIHVLELNSEGGGYYAAFDIADLVIDFQLDTHVRDVCESSCVTVFLAGKNRTMSRGGRIGFHQTSWSAGAIKDYYESNSDREGWETPFDFAAWMYGDTQTEVYALLSYMIARGVDPSFAIQTIRKLDASMWRPYRTVLRAAGVLTE